MKNKKTVRCRHCFVLTLFLMFAMMGIFSALAANETEIIFGEVIGKAGE